MKRIKELWAGQKWIDCIGWILVAVVFLADCIIIMKGTRAFFHSDDATAILYAREQWMQKKIYPEQWNYGTDIWNIGLNTIIIPLLKICSSWLSARAWAVIIQTALALGVFALFRKAGILGKRVWLVLLAALMPVSEVVSEHFYFQATYMTMIIYLAVMILAVFLSLNEKKGLRVAGYCLLAAMLIFRIGTGYSMILVFSAPMLASLFFMIILERHKAETRNKNKIKKYSYVMLVIVGGTIAGAVYNYYLTEYMGLGVSAVGDYEFIQYDGMGNSFVFMLSCFMRLFGAADKSCSLLSLAGVNKALAFVYMVFVLLFVPVSLFRGFRKNLNEKQKIFFCFSLVSTFCVCYLFVISGMEHARYLLWVYFFSFMNLGIWICNFRKFRYSYGREIRVGAAVFFFVLLSGIYGYYLSYDYQKNVDCLGVNNNSIDNTVDYDLIAYLEEKDYTLGYGLYWQSYCYRAASDGKIRMAAIHNNWNEPYMWLNSKKWYKNTGEPCFVLVTKWQYENMPESYKGASYATEEFHEYKILLYHSTDEVQSLWK